MTTTRHDQDIDLTLDDLAGLSTDLVLSGPPQVRYVQTRRPSDASLVASGAVVAVALLGGGMLAAGFTGHLQVDSPITVALILLLYVLAWVAIRARRNADSHAFTVEELS